MLRCLVTLFLLIATSIGALEGDLPKIPKEAAGGVNEEIKPLAELQGEPSAFVDGCVNVITGSWCEHQVDCIISGPKPLSLERYYNSGDPSKSSLRNGWSLNHHGKMHFYHVMGEDFYHAKLEDAFKAVIYFKGDKNNKDSNKNIILPLHPALLRRGVTNLGAGYISARSNIKNSNVRYSHSGGFLKGSDGTTKLFNKTSSSEQYRLMTKQRYLSGNEIDYSYFRRKYLQSIVSKGDTGDFWGSFYFHNLDSDKFKKKRRLDVSASDGREISYRFYKQKEEFTNCDGYFLNEVDAFNHPKQKYFYESRSHRIIRKEEPRGRVQEIAYYHKKENEVGDRDVYVSSEKEPEYHRVKMLQAPVGADETPITTYRFFYDIRTQKKKHGVIKALGGSTEVRDALNHKTIYRFSDEYRLTHIEKYTDSGDLYSTERMVWGEKYSPDESDLIKREMLDANGNVVFCRSYVYDEKGNVLEEHLLGNLTGKTDGELDLFVKKCAYNSDNLVTSEDDGFQKITYEYKPGTDLLTSKLIWKGGSVQLREFYSHDVNGAIEMKIVDDGHSSNPKNLSGITERRITRFSPRKTAPVGLPEVIEEKYYDLTSNQEVLLKRIENTYSDTGRLLKKEVFDANGEFASSRLWEYDAYGNVTKEIGPSGNTIVRDYDVNGNKIYEQGPDFRLSKQYIYDYCNRPIKEVEESNDGAVRTTSYRYDYLGNKVASIDRIGNETHWLYDEFSRPIKKVNPPVYSKDSSVFNPVEYFAYDLMGNATSTIDANSFETITKYTILKKPYEVIHPDGTVEKACYNLDGTVAEKIDYDGVKTCYTYDYQNRVTEEKIFAPGSRLLSSQSWNYNAFHLISETDPEGNLTNYEYDGAGRLVTKQKGNSLTRYGYDALGRKSEVIEYFTAHDFRKTTFEYDLLDNIIEERIEDREGGVVSLSTYEYDESGHRTAIYIHTSEGYSCTKSEYNPFGQITKTTQQDGGEFITIYRDDYFDEYGNRVECVEEIDPNGILTRHVMDTNGRISREEVVDPLGDLAKRVRFYCDGLGNVIERFEDVIAGEELLRTVTTKFGYDQKNREIEVIEAYGEPEQKISRREYTFFGEVSKVYKPDGIVISHHYDPLRRLSELCSSDGTVRYSYTYDLNNNLLRVEDLVHHTATDRQFDENNQLIHEVLANGLEFEYAHDALGRLEKVVLPDKTAIHYDHGPLHLKSVTRESEQNYVHRYHYDLSGKVSEANLPIPHSSIAYCYDTSLRPIGIKSKYWSQWMSEDGWNRADCLTHVSQMDVLGETDSHYTYDSLYQLTSEDGLQDHTYLLDSLFNRIKKDQDDYEINPLNQLLAQRTNNYTYDSNGNLSHIDRESENVICEYDALDRLITVTAGSQREKYYYDSFHRRLLKTLFTKVDESWQKSGKERFLYQGQHEIGVADDEGNISEMRVIGIGCEGEIGSAVLMEFGDQVYVPLHDHRGNVVSLVDAKTEEVVECYRYSAYGEESICDGKGMALEKAINPWRFSSKRVDSLTEWVYFGRRYYDPGVGRWTTPDPECFVDGPNLYCYVNNQPLVCIDPEGTSLFGVLGKMFEGVRIPLFETQVSSPVFGVSSYPSCVKQQTSANYNLGGFKDDYDGVGYSYIHGIWNTRQEAVQTAGMLASMNGGYNVRGTWNASHGLWDLAECVLGRQGVHTKPVDCLKENWNGYFEKATERSILIHVCHSQGVIHTRNALDSYDKELRKRIYVIAVSPGVFIDKNMCGRVVHLVSKRDAVPWTDPIGMMRNKENVVLLSPHPNAPLVDHSIHSPTFRRPMKQYMDYFKNEYGPKK